MIPGLLVSSAINDRFEKWPVVGPHVLHLCGSPWKFPGLLLFSTYTRNVANVVKGTVNCQMFADDIVVGYSCTGACQINQSSAF